jgi:hypothetical protein
MRYQPRDYRKYSGSDDLVSFDAAVSETDLFISSDKRLKNEANELIENTRKDIEYYISKHPEFKESFKPVSVDGDAPLIIKEMAEAAARCDVGPMAAVAGAVAEAVGKGLLSFGSRVIVENGGFIFISSKINRNIGIYTGW